MLVLKRRIGEKLVIGNEVVIEVISIASDGVRLGITAPRDTSVHRFEVFAEIQAANQQASGVPAEGLSLKDLAARLREPERDDQ
jgi:carbon storage regulator